MHGNTFVQEVLGVDTTPLLVRGLDLRDLSTVSSQHALLLFLPDNILLLFAHQDILRVPLGLTQSQVHVPRRIVDSLSPLLVNRVQ